MARRRMKTKRQIEAHRTRVQEALDGKYAQRWGEDGRLALRAAIEALGWAMEPWLGTKRMKTRARIEEMMTAIRQTLSTEKDEVRRRKQCFCIQALGWILERDNFDVLVCFTWPLSSMDGDPRKFDGAVWA